jgi:hypothetical protein
MSLLYRWNFAVGITENWMDDEEQQRIIPHGHRCTDSRRTPHRRILADFWIPRILNRPMSDADRQAVIAVMAQDYGTQDELPQDHIDYVPARDGRSDSHEPRFSVEITLLCHRVHRDL